MRPLVPSAPVVAVVVAVGTAGAVSCSGVSTTPVSAQGAAGQQGGAGDTPVGPVGSLPPRPALVEEAQDTPEGRLTIDPPVVWLDLDAGMAAQPHLTVTNGAAGHLDLTIEPVAVGTGDAGAPQPLGSEDGAAPSAARWVLLAERSLHLGPGERAHLWPTVAVPRNAPDEVTLAALTVHTEGGTEVATLVAVDPGGAPPDVDASARLERVGASEALARLTVRSTEVTSVSGRLELRSWWGTSIAEVEIPPTFVLPGTPRTQEVTFRAPAVPGPYRLVADLAPRDGDGVEASARAFLWSPLAAAVVAVIVVVAALALVARRRRADADA